MPRVPLRFRFNARDIGGKYRNVTIRKHMLYRGKALTHLLFGEKKLLVGKYHLRTIIDLRSHDEISKKPDIQLPHVKILERPVFEREKQGISHSGSKDEKWQIYAELPEMKQIYYSFLEGESLENLSRAIKDILNAPEEDFAVYFHCSEGKDRTGVVAAILLMILGVGRDEIEKDYLKTNRVAKHRARHVYFHVKYIIHKRLLAHTVYPFFIAKLAYLNALFDVIYSRYGSKEAFFKKGLCLSEEELTRFRKLMIVNK